MTRGTHLYWGFQDHAFDTIRGTPGTLREAILFFGYLLVWSLVMGAYFAVFILAGVVTLPLVLIWPPCFLWSKVFPKDKSLRSGHGAMARVLRGG
jgi:hypothetical protein